MPLVGVVNVDSVNASGGIVNSSVQSKLLINGIPVVVIGDKVHSHDPYSSPHDGTSTMNVGSSKVFVDGKAVCRVGDSATCGHTLASGNSKLNIVN
jgi:uncharacterized Zn-binding protein involved in type VI secretion